MPKTMSHTPAQKKAWRGGKVKRTERKWAAFLRDRKQGYGGAATTRFHRAIGYEERP